MARTYLAFILTSTKTLSTLQFPRVIKDILAFSLKNHKHKRRMKKEARRGASFGFLVPFYFLFSCPPKNALNASIVNL